MLRQHVFQSTRNLEAIKTETGSPVWLENTFLAEIRVVYSLLAKQPLGYALDHLNLVVESLQGRDEPHPYAEATLIRTAITASSWSLWLLTAERRLRALQFCFKDIDGFIGFMGSQRLDPLLTVEQRERCDEVIEGMKGRQHWVIDQVDGRATTTKYHTREKFRGKLPKDTAVVQAAAWALPEPTTAFDARQRLVEAWRFMSGYAHGLPWASAGDRVPVGEPDPETGQIPVQIRGNPDNLLTGAFCAWAVIDAATERLKQLSRAA